MTNFFEGFDYTWNLEYTNSSHIFHYTNITSLKSILDFRTIWASECEFLNDYSEMKYIQEILVKVNNLADGNLEEPEIEFFKLISADIERYYIHKASGDSVSSIFVISLTENQDSLSLWSNYSKFDGYNIGFHVENINEYLNYLQQNKTIFDQFHISRIIYDTDRQIRLIFEVIRKVYNHYKTRDNANVIDAIGLAHFMVETYAMFFKKPVFSQEEEYRIAFVINDHKKISNNVDFRVSNGSLIPYLKIPLYYLGNSTHSLLEDAKNPIQNITIGPKNNIDISKLGLRQYLKHKGYDYMKNNINNSQIPLRY